MLYEAYKKYYKDPTDNQQLWDAIAAYQFEEPLEDLIKLRLEAGTHLQLSDYFFTSSGTTGQVRSIAFGPNTDFWLQHLEDHVKYRSENIFTALNMPMFQLSSTFEVEKHEPSGTIPYTYFMSVCLWKSGAVAYLIYQLEQIGKCTLFANPNNWLYLLSDPMFRYYLEHSTISCMSTNWEAFFARPPKRVHFNNNMINWTTTMHFYTCQYNTQHFLPTFIPISDGIINLINLCQRPIMPIDDLMVLSPDIKTCRCGKNYREIKSFIPRITQAIKAKNGEPVYDLCLANKLQAKYHNLQFIQTDNDEVNVLYVCDGEADTDIIANFFATYGLSVKFLPNTFSLRRNKLPVFWRPMRDTYYCKWPPSASPHFYLLGG